MKGETIESLLPYRVVIYAKGVLTTTKYRVLQQTLNWGRYPNENCNNFL